MTNNIAKFFYKLGYSLSCGVPLISGLERLSIDLSNDTWKVEIEKLIEGIKDGHSFTSALINKTAIEADEVLIGILDAGERAGTFDENLQKAAQSIEKGLFSIRLNPQKNQEVEQKESQEAWTSWIEKALEQKASDLHFCPELEHVTVRFRIDGSLQEVQELGYGAYDEFLRAVKIASALDIAERSLPQDGRIKIRFKERELDLRVSTMPCVPDEKLTIRVLDFENVVIEPERVLPDEEDRKQFEEILKAPFGMILICGPTGSGKTTTAYTSLGELSKGRKRSIHTVEDPVEYMIPGVSHLQIRPRIGLTMTAALRTVMRHDSDVVYLSEIRDPESFEIATKIALTGHLIISSLHTSTFFQTIERLRTIAEESSLFSSALSGVICQQLVRVNCTHCKKERQVDQAEVQSLELLRDLKSCVEGEGCELCNHTGYRGRRAVYEFVKLDRSMKEMIRLGQDENLRELLSERGFKDKRQKVQELVKEGISSISECNRLIENQ